jgi:hypothetical protein
LLLPGLGRGRLPLPAGVGVTVSPCDACGLIALASLTVLGLYAVMYLVLHGGGEG